jgi:hypothetical protein
MHVEQSFLLTIRNMHPRSSQATVFTLVAIALSFSVTARAQSPSQKSIAVSEQVAALLRPVLDELQQYRSEGGDRRKVDESFYALTQKKGRLSDEALVVLMCFDIMGESQEETDAVIARGRKMLPYVEKYRKGDPKIARRAYPDSLLKGFSRKESDFQGAIKAIEHGWRGTWDNPEG